MLLRCAYFELLYGLIPAFILIVLYRWFLYRSPIYRYPLTSKIIHEKLSTIAYHKHILFALRAAALLGLIFLTTRPQWVDERSKVNVEGIDIVLAVDVSESMGFFDDLRDRRPRIEVAKQEAIRFIEKRSNDPIGVVIFGREAVSCCPLTLDKSILKEIVGGLKLRMIDSSGTWLGTGLATAVNRLKNSKSQSKIIILLTDGAPTPPEKIDVQTAMELAKQFGIKVYTIGIGNEQGGFFVHPMLGGALQQMYSPINAELLKSIAAATGGKFFRAQNAQEMHDVYSTIDRLEKTEYETNLFHHYYEAFITFIWFVLALIGIELMLKLWLWRGVW
jgi:Ca-activated chloride channel family protein